MKKITGLLLAAVLCMPAYAAQTKNTMKMVSYFPVPYVAYDTVSANNAMDIGVLNQCAMDIKKGSSNLGGSACSLYLYGNANGADLNGFKQHGKQCAHSKQESADWREHDNDRRVAGYRHTRR